MLGIATTYRKCSIAKALRCVKIGGLGSAVRIKVYYWE